MVQGDPARATPGCRNGNPGPVFSSDRRLHPDEEKVRPSERHSCLPFPFLFAICRLPAKRPYAERVAARCASQCVGPLCVGSVPTTSRMGSVRMIGSAIDSPSMKQVRISPEVGQPVRGLWAAALFDCSSRQA